MGPWYRLSVRSDFRPMAMELIRRCRRYLRLIDPVLPIWFHARKEDSMKRFERSTNRVPFRFGALALAAIVVLCLSLASARRAGSVGLVAETVSAAANNAAAQT